MNIFNYLRKRIIDYTEKREAERFDRFMGEVRVEADRILSLGEGVRREFARPEAWRLGCY